MKKVVWVLLVVFLLGAVKTEAQKESFPVKGFAFWLMESQEKDESSDLATNYNISHIWLINSHRWDENLNSFVILSPVGPPRVGHNFQITWSNPIRGVDEIVFGRFIPPFGWEWPHYRIDKLPTAQYSSIQKVLVAKDNGLRISGRIKKFNWVAGAFFGHNIGGNLPISERGKPVLYLRGRYKLPLNLWVGVSERIASVEASGFDAVWEWRDLKFAAEAIRTKENLEYYLLVEYLLFPSFSAVFRFEDLQKDERFIPGLSLKFREHEVKINFNLSKQSPDQALGQLVLRW